MRKNATIADSTAEKKTTRKTTTRKIGVKKTTATRKKKDDKNVSADIQNDEIIKSETNTEEAKNTTGKHITKSTKRTPRKKDTAADTPVVAEEHNTAVAETNDEAATETGATIVAEPNNTSADIQIKPKQELKIPALPQIEIRNIVELSQAPMRSIVLTDQQIQTLTLEEIEQRHIFLQKTLANILDFDVVISDTNIWLELLIGHTSSHSDPRFNARLQFERQLEFISKYTKFRGGRFMMMSETYEEIDRFACMQEPTDHKDADFTDNIVCLNAAARLAKRLILSQQRENRLRIANIGAESHHASFADPAIIRCVAEYFAAGKKVLLLTNDASVAIRSMGICDDLQRHNNISDQEWEEMYAPLRPMVFTFDDLKLLDFYTRQYHYIQMASGKPWMCDIEKNITRNTVTPLVLWQEAFRAGDKRKSDNLFTEMEQKQMMQKQQPQKTSRQQPQRQQKTQQSQTSEQTPTIIPEPYEAKNTAENKQDLTKEIIPAETVSAEVTPPKKKPVRRKPQYKKPAKKEEK